MRKTVYFGSKQKPPFEKPLAYHACYSNVVFSKDNTPTANGYTDITLNCMQPNLLAGPCVNKALDKLYEEMQQASDLLVAWKERQKALDLVFDAVGILVRTARAIRKRDPKIIRRILNRGVVGPKDIAKTPSGLWLQYHFAIVPTISDIHHAMGVFSAALPDVDIVATSRLQTTVFTPLFVVPLNSYWSGNGSYDISVKLGGTLRAVDPHVTLATRLGFGQPLSVAWEMTPFSWFVDYFVNVGDMLKNLEPRFPGIETYNKYTTYKCKGSVSGHFTSADGWGWYPPNSFYAGQMVGVKRDLGWPNYQLQFTSPLDLSGQRVSYIVATLTGILTGMKPRK